MGLTIQGVLIGVIATVGMDIWATVVKHVFRLPTADWAMLGRWFGHMPQGSSCIGLSPGLPLYLMNSRLAGSVVGILIKIS